MRQLSLKVLLLLGCFSTAVSLHAQQIVHAVSGVVTGVDATAQTITLKTNDGSDGLFRYDKSAKPDLIFDKEIRSGTVAPSSFDKVGDHVVAYYYDKGFSSRMLVALKDFGPQGLEHASGTLVKTGHHDIVLKTDSGALQTFGIARDASAETPSGVVSGSRFSADPGTKVTVRYTDDGGKMVVQFIRNNFG
jgi:hypothetical protein